jgi:hypothetical protein
MPSGQPAEPPVPQWLRLVMASDRTGSSWYFGASFLFAPVLAVLSPWPIVTTILWWVIGLTGLLLGLLGIAMAVGLARVLRSGAEIPAEHWRSMVARQPKRLAESVR